MTGRSGPRVRIPGEAQGERLDERYGLGLQLHPMRGIPRRLAA